MNTLPGTKPALDWTVRHYHSLNQSEIQEIFQIRETVFIVEQQCIYEDVDSLDEKCSHVIGRDNTGILVAYARILPPGLKYSAASFGRVLVVSNQRGRKVGRKLVEICIAECRKNYPASKCRISAQTYLIDFYKSFGFNTRGTPYLEDGILHIDMALSTNLTSEKSG